MPFIDFVILLLFIWATYKGWRQGFLKEIFSMAGFVVGLFVAAGLYSSFGGFLSPRIGASPTVANILAFLVLWIVVPILLGLAANLLTKALKGMKIGLPNSILGAVVSVVKYLILMSCVFNVMSFLGIVGKDKAEESYLYEPVKNSLGYAFKAYSESHQQDNAAAEDTVYTNTDSVQ